MSKPPRSFKQRDHEIEWEDFKELLNNLRKVSDLANELAIQLSACADRLEELMQDQENEK